MQDIKVHKIGIYPLSKYYIDQLGMLNVFEQYMPKVKGSTILEFLLKTRLIYSSRYFKIISDLDFHFKRRKIA
jgi:hypothetical protein